MTDASKTIAIVLAAGRGTRAGGTQPKQWQLLLGKPLLAWSVEAFMSPDDMKNLEEMGLINHFELTNKGKEILKQMKLQPKVMKKKIVSSKDHPQFLDDLLGEL